MQQRSITAQTISIAVSADQLLVSWAKLSCHFAITISTTASAGVIKAQVPSPGKQSERKWESD